MRDYSMELAMVAAGVVTDVLGQSLTAKTSYSPDGNNIVVEFSGYPLYGSSKSGKVYVQFPRATFSVRKGCVAYAPLQQAQCRYYQGRIGEQFAHPHIFNDGHPCWDNSRRERAIDFITNIIETFSLENVTRSSIEVGHCASGVMGVGETALRNATTQKQRVNTILNCKPFISNHRKLESYVTKRWCSKISILMRAA